MKVIDEELRRALTSGAMKEFPGFTTDVEEHRTAATIYGCQHIGSSFYISVCGGSLVDGPQVGQGNGGLGERSATEFLHATA